MTVLLFGVLTDYSIFFMARFRAMLEERGRWSACRRRAPLRRRAPARVATAGLVIALATGSLYFAQLGFLHGLGPGLAITVLVAMLVAATFVPAALAIARESDAVAAPGRRGRCRARRAHRGRRACGPPRRAVPDHSSRRPCCALLLVAATGLLRIHTANPQMTNLPADSSVNRGYVETSRAFVPGMAAPTTVVVERRGIDHDRRPLAKLERLLSQQPGVAGVIGPADNPLQKPLGVVLADRAATPPVTWSSSRPIRSARRAISAVQTIRTRMPDLLAAARDERHASAGRRRFRALGGHRQRHAFGPASGSTPIALAVIFLMLALLLRALVAPVYLLAASILGLLAALGLTTYFFEGVLGHSGISIFVPLTIAVLLLSMGCDYNVFLVGRIWHEARVRPLREAIEVAGGRSTRAITVAGLVLAGSFGAAALIPLDSFRELAFGMAVGLLIDALIVRALLVPALISIVGPASGWPGKRPGTAASTPAEDSRDAPPAEPAYLTDATNPRTSATGSE